MDPLAFTDIPLPESPEERARFEVTDLEKAAWAMRKLAHIRSKQGEVQALADKEIIRLQAWADEQKSRMDGDAQFFEGLLTAYHRRTLAADPKHAKTIKLPHGELTSRAQPDKWEINADALLPQLKAIGRLDLIRIKEEPMRDEIKAAFKVDNGRVIDLATGEVLEGVTVAPGGIKFSIEVVE